MILTIVFLSGIYAECDEEQIDINSADKEQFLEIIYIGEVRADYIIEERPFDSVDDLINIKGIGEVTLDKIKEQNLACVENEKEKEIENSEEPTETENKIEENEEENEEEKETISDVFEVNSGVKTIEMESIILNPKDIKTRNEREEQRSNYTVYGLFLFCMLIACLFVFKKISQKRYKNEFR